MRRLLLASLLSFSFAAFAQSIGKNMENADVDPNKLDPAAKARVRVEGAAGGTGARISEEASGGASVGSGSQHRHSTETTRDPGAGPAKGPPRDEKSNERGAPQSPREK
jgi:hypothetical protein